MPDPFGYYRQLLAKTDELSARITARHSDALQCRRGCTACCRQDLSVARVESDHITAWLDKREQPLAPPDANRTDVDQHALFAMLAGPQPCAFLGAEGACQIYDVRPVICRSHGLPVLDPDGRRDACPLNFDGSPDKLAALPDSEILDLARLNTVLAAVDHRYVEDTGGPADRVHLTEVRARYGK